MRKTIRSCLFAASAIVGPALFAACSDSSSTAPVRSPLADLVHFTSADTSVSADQTGSGSFHGTVVGPSAAEAGADSMATAPRLAGVEVGIFPKVPSTDGTVTPGPQVGSAVTGADGTFQLPTLPAGEYIVTFVPPANSGYRGSYAFGPLRSNSSQFPWWVVLSHN
jgi:hypothetical protein